MINLAVSS